MSIDLELRRAEVGAELNNQGEPIPQPVGPSAPLDDLPTKYAGFFDLDEFNRYEKVVFLSLDSEWQPTGGVRHNLLCYSSAVMTRDRCLSFAINIENDARWTLEDLVERGLREAGITI